MPPKRKIDLPDHVRSALLADVELTYQHSLDAEEASRIRIHLALEQGVTTRELESQLGVPQQTISRWGRQGKEALQRREQGKRRVAARSEPASEDPLGSRELVAYG